MSAFDISLWYEGEELIPEEGSVSVTFQSSVIAAEDVFNCEVFHLEEETQQVKLLEAVERQEDSITFETGHFSIYGFLLMAGSREEWDTVKGMELYKTSMNGSSGTLDGQSDKINILLFGRMGICPNTMKVAESLEALLTDEAAEKVNVYLLDVSRPRTEVIQDIGRYPWNHVTVCSAPNDSGYYGNHMWPLVRKTIQPSGSITLPAVFIFDQNQSLQLSETESVSQDKFAEVLLSMDSTLELNNYISVEDIYRANQMVYEENRSDREALDYYCYFDAQAYPGVYEKALEITAGYSTDSEKLWAIYEWVAENVYYDRDSFQSGSSGVTEPEDILDMKPMRCVCEGYANLFRDLCRAAGIPCKVVHGYALGVGAESYWTEAILNGNESNHAWNEAYVGGKWRILDVTWDSQNTYENGAEKYAPMQDVYFDSSLRNFSKDHKLVATEDVDAVQIIDLHVAKNAGEVKLEWDTAGEPGYGGQFAVYYKGVDGDYVWLTNTQWKFYVDASVQAGEKRCYKVTYLSENGYETAGQELEVSVQSGDIEITIPLSEKLYIGQKKKLEVTYDTTVATNPDIIWSSGDDSIVTVNQDGIVVGNAPRYTYVTATCGSKSSRCWISVVKVKDVAEARVTDNYSGYVRFEWKGQGFYSVVERKNTVGGQYEILSRDAQEYFEDRTAEPGASYTYHVYNRSGDIATEGAELEVKVSDSEIKLPKQMTLKSGKNGKLMPEYVGFGEHLPAMIWSSSNPDVAVVDGQGNVSTVGEGKAVIALAVKDGHYHVTTEVFCAAADCKKYGTNNEWSVIELVNKERMDNGLQPLSVTEKMQQAVHIRRQEVKSYFSHTRPDGTSCFTVFGEVGVNAYGAGENIAQGYNTPSSVMKGWMNSSGHRANILTAHFSHMGAGEVSRNWVQMFAGCPEPKTYALLLPNDPLTVSKGTSIEDMGIMILAYCDNDGMGYIPLIEEMCSGYEKNTVGEQVVTIVLEGYTDTFHVTVNKSGGGGSGSGGGGGGGGDSSSGGSTSIAGSAAIGGPGAAANAVSVNQITTLPEHVTAGSWEATAHGWHLKKADGLYAANQWAFLDGKWYLMGSDSYMRTGWQLVNQAWYYLNADGSMAVGWVFVGNKWYYLAEAGNMVSGWIFVNNRWYYLNPDGSMATGRVTVDGKAYYLGSDGALL